MKASSFVGLVVLLFGGGGVVGFESTACAGQYEAPELAQLDLPDDSKPNVDPKELMHLPHGLKELSDGQEVEINETHKISVPNILLFVGTLGSYEAGRMVGKYVHGNRSC